MSRKPEILTIRLRSSISYDDFLKELERQDLDTKKYLAAEDIKKISKMPSGCLEYLIQWILNCTLLVSLECKALFQDRIPAKQFA